MDKMTINKQDLLARINQLEKQQEGIAAELKDLSGMVKNLPDTNKQGLHFEDGEMFYFVDTDGNVYEHQYHEYFWEIAQNNRAFRSREMAEMFAEKTQFIADSLMWKELYDRDYVPEWDIISRRNWVVIFDHARGKYDVVGYSTWGFGNVCFSSEEIAQGLADWLNSRKRDNNG